MKRTPCWAVVCLISLACFPYSATAQEKSINFSAVYTGEVWANTKGGIDTGTRYLSDIDLQLDARIGNGTLFLYGLYTNDTALSDELIGDVQVVSNIDNTEVFRLYEAWYSYDFADDTASITVGLIDLNSEFDAIEPAGLFLNSSHGIGAEFAQTGENGPSIFPSTSLASVVEFTPGDNWFVRLGLFDAIPNDPNDPDRMKISLGDGALLVGEADYATGSGFRLAGGVWGYTSDFETIDSPNTGSGREGRNWGAYAFGSGDIFSSNSGNQLTGWLRYGFADNTDVNFLKSYLGAGLVYTGLFQTRPEDQIGFGIAMAFIGSPAKAAARRAGEAAANAETSIEFTYRTQINDWLAIQPDIQYVVNPGIVGGLKDAFVIGFRFEVALMF